MTSLKVLDLKLIILLTFSIDVIIYVFGIRLDRMSLWLVNRVFFDAIHVLKAKR